ncbi:MAG TPA: hypothetical protein VIN08_22115 [Ohtaekwangia sp.]|uniref:hypothetical protein n=1 Tax=Ohtaekwangia sp. TaxID=2066019 RepID=UPI002F93FC2A
MNDLSLALHPAPEGWWFIGILTLLGIFLLWKELKRTIRFTGLRMAAVVIALLAIAALSLRPSFKTKKESTAILLTDGYTKEQADSLYKVHPSWQYFHLANAKAYKKSIPLSSVNDISTIASDIRIVLGNGLPATGWKQLPSASVQYIPGNTPEGVTELHIPQAIFTHHEAIVYGTYTLAGNKTTLVLKSPAGEEDSVTLQKNGTSTFSLAFTPRQSGKFLYQLVIKERERTITEEIPLVVHDDTPYTILFLQQQPTFETQYLKSFLARQHHRVVVRSQLSRNIYRHEYINHPNIPVTTLSTKTLKDFDLVILNTETWQALSSSEVKALEDAVSTGLGVLLLMQEPGNRSIQRLIPWGTSPAKTDTTSVILHHKPYTLAIAPFTITSDASLQSIMRNKRGIASGFGYKGVGKAGFQLLQSTYPLLLQGDSIAYSKIWSPVLEQLARSRSVDNAVRIISAFPLYANAPVTVELITTGNKPALTDDSIALPLAEDARIDDRWEATTWQRNPGWHILTTHDSLTHPYYISRENAWQSLHAANLVRLSHQYGIAINQSGSHEQIIYKPVSPLIFYSLLLLALAVLWFAPKL